MTILRDCYEGLVSMAPDGTPVAGAAESWTVSEDGRRYTFRLRAGRALVERRSRRRGGFRRRLAQAREPATASQYALMLEPVANATDIVAGRKSADSLGVAAPDEATLVVDLAEPSPYFLAMLSHPSTFPVHRPTLAAKPEGVRAARRRGDERRVHARPSGRSARTFARRGTPTTGTTRRRSSTPCATCTSPIRRPSSRAFAPATST